MTRRMPNWGGLGNGRALGMTGRRRGTGGGWLMSVDSICIKRYPPFGTAEGVMSSIPSPVTTLDNEVFLSWSVLRVLSLLCKRVDAWEHMRLSLIRLFIVL